MACSLVGCGREEGREAEERLQRMAQKGDYGNQGGTAGEARDWERVGEGIEQRSGARLRGRDGRDGRDRRDGKRRVSVYADWRFA